MKNIFAKFKKYQDAIKSNSSFYKTHFTQKLKISYNLLRYIITIIKKPLILRNKPVIAQIEPTSNCNLNCEFCIRKKIGLPIGSMSLENFKKILDKLDCLFKIHLSGQGEPLLNPDIFKMIKYANKKGATIFFTTNGTLLTKKIISRICDSDIGEIGISIDSTDKEKYEKIRRGAKFEIVKENIKNLTNELKKRKKKTIISLSCVLLTENSSEVQEFISLANFLGIKKISFQKIQGKEDYLKKYNRKMKQNIIQREEYTLISRIKKAKKLGKKYDITVIFDEEKSSGCIWPWRSIYITWNGYITPCCKILNYKKPFFGNILKSNLWCIWNGREYQKFRELLRHKKSPESCKGCNMI